MLKGLITTGIVIFLLLSTMGGVMGSGMEERGKHGYFKGTTFNNLRIVVNINEDYAIMKNAKNGDTLVEKAYPVI